MINGRMFGRLHNSVWETIQDITTASSGDCGEEKSKCQHDAVQLKMSSNLYLQELKKLLKRQTFNKKVRRG